MVNGVHLYMNHFTKSPCSFIVGSTLAIQPLACQLNHFPLLVPRSGRGTQFEVRRNVTQKFFNI